MFCVSSLNSAVQRGDAKYCVSTSVQFSQITSRRVYVTPVRFADLRLGFGFLNSFGTGLRYWLAGITCLSFGA